MIKAVLFDMDGVLVDSEEIMTRSAITYFNGLGVSPKEEDFIPYIGAGEKAYMGGVAEKYGIAYEEGTIDEVYTIYGEIVEQSDISFPGAADVLHKLKENGYQLALCTSAHPMKAEYNLRALGLKKDFFGAFVTGADITRNKPAPDVFLTAAEKLGVEPEYCCVVEDAINGIRGAKAGNMRCIALPTTFTKEQLAAESPDKIIEDIRELPDALKTI